MSTYDKKSYEKSKQEFVEFVKQAGLARVTGGEYYPYFKDVRLFGRPEGETFTLYGCHKDDEDAFYKAVYEYDKATGFIGLKSQEDAKEFWECGCEGLSFLINGGFEMIEQEEQNER